MTAVVVALAATGVVLRAWFRVGARCPGCRRGRARNDGASHLDGEARGVLLGSGVWRHARDAPDSGAVRLDGTERRGAPSRTDRPVRGRRPADVADWDQNRRRTIRTARRGRLLGLAGVRRLEVDTRTRLLRRCARAQPGNPAADASPGRADDAAGRAPARSVARTRLVGDASGFRSRSAGRRLARLATARGAPIRVAGGRRRRGRVAAVARLEPETRLALVLDAASRRFRDRQHPQSLRRDAPRGARTPSPVHAGVARRRRPRWVRLRRPARGARLDARPQARAARSASARSRAVPRLLRALALVVAQHRAPLLRPDLADAGAHPRRRRWNGRAGVAVACC